MTWYIMVSCHILRGMYLAVDSYEEFKKELDRLIDDALLTRCESGQGLILVNLFGRYVYCKVTIENDAFLFVQHSDDEDIFIKVVKFEDGWKGDTYYPTWTDVSCRSI